MLTETGLGNIKVLSTFYISYLTRNKQADSGGSGLEISSYRNILIEPLYSNAILTVWSVNLTLGHKLTYNSAGQNKLCSWRAAWDTCKSVMNCIPPRKTKFAK